MADNANPLASLSAAELASLAKAQAAGVSVVGKDGQTVDISSQTPPAADAAAAAAAAAKPPANTTADPTTSTAAKARPDNVPEKFWDAATGAINTEALLKSYTELEKTRTKPAESTATKPATMGEQKPATETPATPPAVDPAAATQARDAAIAQASADISTKGALDETTYAALEKVGYTRGVVDEFVAGQKAQATLAMQTIHTAAGGKEAYDQMVAWGSANYSPAEQAAFNKAIHSGDAGMSTMAVSGLKARYGAEFGKTGARVEGGNGGQAAGNAFQSQQELVKAMSDPRYKSGDAAFHREVTARIQASQRAGIDIGIRIQR